MAQHVSAEKRNRQNQVRKARNIALRSRMRSAMKAARTALESKAADRADVVKSAVASIQRAATKHIVTRETAQRYVSRLMRAAAAVAK
jgi:small subunit ribosomal protein S20